MSESGLYSDDSDSNTDDFLDDEEDDSYDYTGEDDSNTDEDISEEVSDSREDDYHGIESYGGHYYCQESQQTSHSSEEKYLKKFVLVFSLSIIAVVMACYYVL